MFDPLVGRLLQFWLSRQAVRALDVSRPRGSLRVHAVGPDADRILMVIDRPSEAEGAVSQELGFAGHLARQLSVLTGRGTDLDIIANGTMTARNCGAALDQVELARFDAIVLMVGSSEAARLTSEQRWKRDLSSLLDSVEARTPHGLHVFVIAIPPVEALIGFPRPFARRVGQRIRRLNYVSRVLCHERERVSALSFDIQSAAPDGRNSRSRFNSWAMLIAPAIHTELSDGEHQTPTPTGVDEQARQRALDQLAVVDTYPSPDIDRLVESARNLFGTTAAAVTFLDNTRRWVKSAVGTGMADSPRADSLCDLTIGGPGVFVVEDTHREPRLWASRGDNESIHFYAGYPLEARTGHRVGVLCIMNEQPRGFSASDASLLRELALQVQSELWD